MSYKIVKSTNFIHSAKKFAQRDSNFIIELNTTLQLLSDNPFDRRLKTHKLKGELQDYWACSINYNIRLVFQFVQAFDKDTDAKIESILLSTVGSHDVVY